MDAREGASTPELDEAIARVEADMPRRKPVQPQVREFLRIKVRTMAAPPVVENRMTLSKRSRDDRAGGQKDWQLGVESQCNANWILLYI